MLGPLASNGGPTQTMALLPGSPAIDAGEDTVCAASPVNGLDQRGYTRPAGSPCDIGAFELDAVPNQPPTLVTDHATVSVYEGQTASDTGTVSDPNNDSVSLSASIGSVITNGNGTWSWSFETSDGPSESQTVTISGDDGHGGTNQTSFSLVVAKVAPTATFVTPSGAVQAGDPFTLSLTNPLDPSTADTTAGFTYVFDCGSGYGAFSSSNSASCTATGTASQSVKAQIKDKDGGSTEYTGSVNIVTDTTAPVTTATAVTGDTAAYPFGTWTKQAVTVTLSASDSGGSGVATIFYTLDDGDTQTYTAPFTLSTENSSTIVYWSVDHAGNEETPHQSVSVNIDTTGPTISGIPTTSPNTNGWYSGPVTIHWTCSDALSGVATCPVDQTISTEGSNQSVSGTATDLAGTTRRSIARPSISTSPHRPTSLAHLIVLRIATAGTTTLSRSPSPATTLHPASTAARMSATAARIVPPPRSAARARMLPGTRRPSRRPSPTTRRPQSSPTPAALGTTPLARRFRSTAPLATISRAW
ncbi:MAG TPA: choice-of-anchor Q domain-containing protein [Nitrolancea sp.]